MNLNSLLKRCPKNRKGYYPRKLGWRADKCIKRIGYKLECINHSKEFVKQKKMVLKLGNELHFIKVHKNHKENLWGRMKRSIILWFK